MLKTIKDFLKLDPILLLGCVSLLLFSSILIYISSSGEIRVVQINIVHWIIGFGFMLAFKNLSVHNLKILSLILFGIIFISLLFILGFGHTSKGAQRWLDLGFVRLQPSELVKIFLPATLAFLIHKKPIPIKFQDQLIPLGLIAITVVLVSLQPDLGTAIVIGVTGLLLLFFAGISWYLIGFGAVSIAIAIPLVWNFYMHQYQKDRVMILFNPELDPLGKGYHIIQSKIAIGSGGIFGKGFGKSTQTNLNFLPESTTDFIFSVLSESFGLIGTLILLSIYTVVILRIYYIAHICTNVFLKLLNASLASLILISIFINISMVSGMMPVVGLPLPFVSYGGTALISMMIIIGIASLTASYNKNEKKSFIGNKLL